MKLLKNLAKVKEYVRGSKLLFQLIDPNVMYQKQHKGASHTVFS